MIYLYKFKSTKQIYPGRVSIFAVSYVTLWLDRFLPIYPNLVQSAIMGSILNFLLSSDSRTDLWPSSISLQFTNRTGLE